MYKNRHLVYSWKLKKNSNGEFKVLPRVSVLPKFVLCGMSIKIRSWLSWLIPILPFWTNDVWHQKCWSTLVQVMVCCLSVPSHHLYQGWFFIIYARCIHWRAPRSAHNMCSDIILRKLLPQFPGANQFRHVIFLLNAYLSRESKACVWEKQISPFKTLIQWTADLIKIKYVLPCCVTCSYENAYPKFPKPATHIQFWSQHI